jgi:hypothetical protein
VADFSLLDTDTLSEIMRGRDSKKAGASRNLKEEKI